VVLSVTQNLLITINKFFDPPKICHLFLTIQNPIFLFEVLTKFQNFVKLYFILSDKLPIDLQSTRFFTVQKPSFQILFHRLIPAPHEPPHMNRPTRTYYSARVGRIYPCHQCRLNPIFGFRCLPWHKRPTYRPERFLHSPECSVQGGPCTGRRGPRTGRRGPRTGRRGPYTVQSVQSREVHVQAGEVLTQSRVFSPGRSLQKINIQSREVLTPTRVFSSKNPHTNHTDPDHTILSLVFLHNIQFRILFFFS